MLRTIDRHAGYAIQKVTTSRGKTVRYQTVAESSVGDTSAVTGFSTLKEAKLAVGAPTYPAAKAVRK